MYIYKITVRNTNTITISPHLMIILGSLSRPACQLIIPACTFTSFHPSHTWPKGNFIKLRYFCDMLTVSLLYSVYLKLGTLSLALRITNRLHFACLTFTCFRRL